MRIKFVIDRVRIDGPIWSATEQRDFEAALSSGLARELHLRASDHQIAAESHSTAFDMISMGAPCAGAPVSTARALSSSLAAHTLRQRVEPVASTGKVA